MEVSLLVPEGACTDEEKKEAQSCGITVVEAKKLTGYEEPLDWLISPPQDLRIDVVIGHGGETWPASTSYKKLWPESYLQMDSSGTHCCGRPCQVQRLC